MADKVSVLEDGLDALEDLEVLINEQDPGPTWIDRHNKGERSMRRAAELLMRSRRMLERLLGQGEAASLAVEIRDYLDTAE